jgi:hypothetical protein
VSERPRVLVELGVELDRVARETLSGDEPSGSGTVRWRGWRRWHAIPVLAVLVLGGAAVAFASGLFSFGAPVASTPVFSDADVGLGAVLPGTVKLLPIATPDPQGGPAWGMRVMSTTRGAGCVQVGRLVGGKLAALGQDDAFDNDGRAHELPLSAAINTFSCTLLDSKGQFFNSVTVVGQSASAAWWFRSTSCVPTGTPRSASAAHPACPLRDERDVYYGVLGPDAKSITYILDGKQYTKATVGSPGAYLIVTDAPSAHQPLGGAGGGTGDDVPVFSPITSIQYRGGTTCHLLTAHKWIVGFHACKPALNVPLGYVRAIAPTRAQIAAPIHARLINTPARVVHFHARPRRGLPTSGVIHVPASQQLVVTFKSRIAITTMRGQYGLEWHDSRMQPQVDGFTMMGTGGRLGIGFSSGELIGAAGAGTNVAVGQTVTGTITSAIGPRAPASLRLIHGETVHGTITLRYSTGPSIDGDLPTAKIPVGSFTITIP